MTQFRITDYGAVPDGRTKNTEAIRRAMEACMSAGGGTVIVDAGTFLTGAIHLVSNMRLHLEPGATVLFSDDPDDYPTVESRWAGTELFMFSPLIFGKDLENVAITGRGTFDGNPKRWWNDFYTWMQTNRYEPITDRAGEFARLNAGRYENTDCGGLGLKAQCLRPPLMELNNCRDVSLEGFTNQNSPFWNTHLLYCTNVTVHNVTFRNPPGAPNGDGLDIDSCFGVRVSDCSFDVNDDCLCLKSGMNDDGYRVGKATENVTITNCTMLRGHGGVVMGSDGAGGIGNVTVSNCVFLGTQRGIRLKSNRGRYSVFEDLRFNNIVMDNVLCPIVMNLYYTCGATEKTREIVSDPAPRPIVESTPRIRNVHISNVTARGKMAAAGVLIGLPERPIENVTLDNVVIEGESIGEPYTPAMAFNLEPMQGEGVYGRHVKELSVRNSRINATNGPVFNFVDSSDIELSAVTMATADESAPVVSLERVDGARIRNCRQTRNADTFVRASGDENSAIFLVDNDPAGVGQPVDPAGAAIVRG